LFDMKCPNCIAVDLLMSERQGIEIDYCPSCRGVWLDRGELDRFIQRAEEQSQRVASGSRTIDDEDSGGFGAGGFSAGGLGAEAYEGKREDKRRREHDSSFEDRSDSRGGKKKESFWSNLFDFD
jgi:hypothetical protein